MSTALSASDASVPARALPSANAEERDYQRVRAALAKSIDDDLVYLADVMSKPEPDFAHFRRRYVARQQAMEKAIPPLRARLRASIAARAQPLGQLAAIDAVMEQAIATREQTLLASVPALMEKRFELLREAQRVAANESPDERAEELAKELVNAGASEAPGGGLADQPPEWIHQFSQDMHEVLLAELDMRMQPAAGLLEALRGK